MRHSIDALRATDVQVYASRNTLIPEAPMPRYDDIEYVQCATLSGALTSGSHCLHAIAIQKLLDSSPKNWQSSHVDEK